MKVLVLLLLSLLGYAEGINNCGKHKRFRVTKGDENYTLELCISIDNCTEPIDFISRNNTCTYCTETLRRSGQDCGDESSCEAQIDAFFSNYCENTAFNQYAISSVTPFTQLITTTNEVLPTVTTKATTKPSDEGANICAPVAALRALIGLFLVILVLVVTGWVCTCWIMKKKIKVTQLCKNCQDCESEEERFCPNQIYEMTTTEPVVGTAIEQVLDSLEQSGQSNNGLSSKDNKSYRDVKRVENVYTSSDGSTQSSLQEEQAMNRVEEEESGEKHVYHVLEKPGGNDYDDPDKDLEENTATEYETPVPLN